MFLNNIFSVTDGIIFDALSTQFWIPSAFIFGFGLIYTIFPRWRSRKTNRDKSDEIHMASQLWVVLFIGIPLLFLSLLAIISTFNERQILSSNLKNGEIQYYQGTVTVLSSHEAHQRIMIAGHIFETHRNSPTEQI